MFRSLSIVILSFVVSLLLNCSGSFSTRFERIEPDKLRTLAFVYDNRGYAEGAPGDTIKFKAYFAGKSISTVNWTATTNVLTGQLGVDTFKDTFSLAKYMIPGTYHEYFGGNTDSVTFDFVLPKDMLRKQFDQSKALKDVVPDTILRLFPANISTMKVADLMNLLDQLSFLSKSGIPAASSGLDISQYEKSVLYLTQTMTMNMMVFAVLNNSQRVQSTFTVRYNSALHALFPSVVVNRNPEIDWIRIYRVKGKRNNFELKNDYKDTDTFFVLDTTKIDTIPITSGFSYFLVADTGLISTVDSGMSYTSGNRYPEIYRYNWFYRNEDTVSDFPIDSLLLVNPGLLAPSAKMLPPVTSKMKHFSLWLVVNDEFIGEVYRPKGMCIKKIRGYFKFADGY